MWLGRAWCLGPRWPQVRVAEVLGDERDMGSRCRWWAPELVWHAIVTLLRNGPQPQKQPTDTRWALGGHPRTHNQNSQSPYIHIKVIAQPRDGRGTAQNILTPYNMLFVVSTLCDKFHWLQIQCTIPKREKIVYKIWQNIHFVHYAKIKPLFFVALDFVLTFLLVVFASFGR